MAADATQRTILVVDDDPDIRDYASRVLEECGYTVLTAPDGAAALVLLCGDDHIDLLFTDVVMPGLDGAEVARRALQRSPNLKVLLASGYMTGPTLGCRLLKKPYRPQQLAGEVAAALGRQRPGE